MTLSTKYSKSLKVNFKHVILFLRKVNQIEFYYMGKKYTIDIDNDKNEYEIGDIKLKNLILKTIKEEDQEKKARQKEKEKQAKKAAKAAAKKSTKKEQKK